MNHIIPETAIQYFRRITVELRWGYGRSFLFLILLLLPFFAAAQADEPVGDEITVSLEVKGVGVADIPAIYNDKDVYLSLPAVFDLIKIRNTVSPNSDTVSGFFLNEKDDFLIDKSNKKIFYQGKVINLRGEGLIKSGTNLYMDLKYFKVFSLDGIFYFRRLVVTMNPGIELPVMREMRQDLMRKNLNRLQGDQKADTSIKLQRPFFHFGMADWAVMSSQQSQGGDQTTVNLGLGAALAGGEANASLNYYSQQAFTEKLQFYQWRYVNNDLAALRQVVAGKIFANAISSLYAPVVGVQFTNAPTTYRHAYGTYRLSNTTDPGWVVELYVNDVLVDYVKADASGFYSFDVPLVYGYTIVKLKFYGPYGEERTAQQYISIPFNFLPKHEFEYAVSGGIVEDGHDSRFSRLSTNYGLTNYVTVGGGVEYLSSVTSGNTMPFVNTSIRLSRQMLLSGDYVYGVRSREVFSYRLPSNIQLDLDYTKYNRGQTAIYYNYLEERKAVISMPIHAKTLSLFSRITVDQVIVPETRYTNTEWAIMGFYRKVGINFSTYASFVRQSVPYIYSIAAATLPLPKKITFTAQLQYDYKEAKPVFLKLDFEKRLFGKGYANLSYQEYFNIHTRNLLVGLRYDFSFSRVAVSILSGSDGGYSRVEAASGSFIVDAKTSYYNSNNRANVGKSGIVIDPYIDVNGNGQHDKGEPRAPGLRIRVNGGRTIYDDADTIIRILDLEPYYKYFIELNRDAFDNISWQIRNKTVSVTASPNNFTVVEVPVVVVGEVSGVVSVKTRDAAKAKGQGQISVGIYGKDSILVTKAVTESDGFFTYLGLLPGSYFVRVDSTQLNQLHYKSIPAVINIGIKSSIDGDLADGLEFVLQPASKDSTGEQTGDLVNTEDISPGKGKAGQKGSTRKQVIGEKGSFAVLVEVYGDLRQAGTLKAKLIRAFPQAASIVQDGNDYLVEMVGFNNRRAAEKVLSKLSELGFPEALVVKLKEQVVK